VIHSVVESTPRDGDWDADFSRLATRLVPAIDGGYRSIAFIAGQRGEGTTTVVHQLAIRLADQGRKRVLVIDANLRQPSLHRRLGGSRNPGLAEFLDGSVHFSQVTQRLSRLHLIPAGTSKEPATRLLESPRLAEGLYLLAEEYDAILIDSPSFVDHPETESLLRRVDGCVFVAEASRVRVPAAQTVVGHIRKSGVEMLGAVLNKREYPIPSFFYRG